MPDPVILSSVSGSYSLAYLSSCLWFEPLRNWQSRSPGGRLQHCKEQSVYSCSCSALKNLTWGHEAVNERFEVCARDTRRGIRRARPPYHPYTRLLIASVPELRNGWLEETMQTQEAQAGIDRVVKLVEVGCPFFHRCLDFARGYVRSRDTSDSGPRSRACTRMPSKRGGVRGRVARSRVTA